MQYYETCEKDYYEGYGQKHGHEGYVQKHGHEGYVQKHGQEGYVQRHAQEGYGLGHTHDGYGQSQSRQTVNYSSHGGFLDGHFKGGQKSQSGLVAFVGQFKSHEGSNAHGHDQKLFGQHQKKTHEKNKGMNGHGIFGKIGEKKHKKKNKDGHGSGSGNESGSGSGSDSDCD